ncbi:MAG: nucleotidyl transferase AbiEii/AbiGii toxin family protein [Verrucomicrobiae bacterium]|nr:nucleotidyl transferase AbiEii/AbiGii toxin family protein [Verrucomicrobiae bacterium]
MFNRPQYRRIAFILQNLKKENLVACGCLFGGGTALSLQLGEYRESLDIDFLCGSAEFYGKLRKGFFDKGASFLFHDSLSLSRELRADRSALRCTLDLQDGEKPIKFEIILEGYLGGLLPSTTEVCGIPCLHPQDSMATKLMANADRGLDGAFAFRDLIDFIMTAQHFGPISLETLSRVKKTYDDTAEKAAVKTARYLIDHPEKLATAFLELSINDDVRSLIKKKITHIATTSTIF